ncbi:hypothetical protein DX927_07780 [Bacillus swezeyi]|uniref:Uncharacterized protein n=1 Tax=Bacillus swezeyi TaxID=1925020 RepID=A0A5M8RV82_9BACI|nr:hypothetical protein DX927_07780 [Bacillus swezeyi]
MSQLQMVFKRDSHELNLNRPRHFGGSQIMNPKGYFTIRNVDEYCYCLDAENMKDGECSVVNRSANEE